LAGFGDPDDRFGSFDHLKGAAAVATAAIVTVAATDRVVVAAADEAVLAARMVVPASHDDAVDWLNRPLSLCHHPDPLVERLLGEARHLVVNDGVGTDTADSCGVFFEFAADLESHAVGWLLHRADNHIFGCYSPRLIYVAVALLVAAGILSASQVVDPLLLFEHLIDGDRLDDGDLTALRKMIDETRQDNPQ